MMQHSVIIDAGQKQQRVFLICVGNLTWASSGSFLNGTALEAKTLVSKSVARKDGRPVFIWVIMQRIA